MASWNDLVEAVRKAGTTYDLLRRQHLHALHKTTGRNVIVYYSGWLQKGDVPGIPRGRFLLNDADKDGFMAVIHRLDRSKGLDLLLHTPGGEMAATESIVDYLRSMFANNIRAVVPQLAMSAGTMIACSCRKVLMGKQSSLGPIDPQINGLPAHGIIEEFNRAKAEIAQSPSNISLWQPIIAKYHPALIGECEKAITWSAEIVQEWLATGMFENMPDAQVRAQRIVAELGDHAMTKSHARHISLKKAMEAGLEVEALEDNPQLQDAVLTVHHACMLTLSETSAGKIIENHLGVARMELLR